VTIMSRRWNGSEDHGLPQSGDVARFVHLHLDTAAEESQRSDMPAVSVYRVEGKARPMLVLHRLARCERGRSWFLVLPITSKGRDGRGHVLPDCEPIGNCIDADVESFVKMEVLFRLPENLLHREGGNAPAVKPCDPHAYRNALTVIRHKAMRGWLGKR